MVNDLGVDPDEWFAPKPHPHDSMPIAKDGPLPIRQSFGGCYNYERLKAEKLIREDPPTEFMEVPTSVKNPKPEPKKKEEKTIHQKMYEIATSRYNPFSVGGSENCDSDLSCNIGGSENASEK